VRGPKPHRLWTENDLRHHKARVCVLVLAAASPVFGQYGGFGGPSILSRNGGPSGRTGSNPVGFSVFAGASGTYTTNLNRVADSAVGNSVYFRDQFGLNASGGVQGYKTNERSATSVDLSVIYSWTKTRDVSRGLSESLAFSHSRQISRRVMWFIGAQGQSTNRSLIFANERYSPEPIPDLPSPQEEIFDTRTYMGNIGTGFSFQKSARLAFAVQGGAFGNERKSSSLIDSRGFTGGGSVQYSLSRRQTVGATFTYGTFYFPGRYGETQYYSPQALYGLAISKVWTLSLGAGLYHAHTDRLVAVPVDPFIAQLTGQRTALEIFSGDSKGFSGQISLNGNYRRWGVSFNAIRGIAPGNGLYLTSERTSVNASVNRTLSRSASVSLYARASELKALTQTVGNARYYSGGSSLSYRLNSYLNFSTSVAVYRTQAAGQSIKLNRFAATAGIFFSPGELPLHIF
jgi:hypothetical protein